jgi:dolichyl-phosphate-mannose--protein O-mannosyl transferase
MVDWSALIFNGLWVLGAALILAAFSFSSYEARRRGEPLRVRLAATGFQLPFMAGLALVSLGIALTAGSRWWERVLWGLLCILGTWQLWIIWRAWRTERD